MRECYLLLFMISPLFRPPPGKHTHAQNAFSKLAYLLTLPLIKSLLFAAFDLFARIRKPRILVMKDWLHGIYCCDQKTKTKDRPKNCQPL